MGNALFFYDNGNDVVIAFSSEDAAKVWEETTGEKWQDFLCDEDSDAVWGLWEVENPRLIVEDMDDANEIAPDGAIIEGGDGKYITIMATQQQWIDKLGRCFWGSQDW